MTIERARLLMNFEELTDEEVRQQIVRDKNAMREMLQVIAMGLTTDEKN